MLCVCFLWNGVEFVVLAQNHRGAMMELGEGLCKLRKMEFQNGPFHTFEREISAVLDFIYLTQIELAACEFFSFTFFSHYNSNHFPEN